MIKYTPASERTLALFSTPFQQKLKPDNRWVKMAALVPWDDMAKVFYSSMSSGHGRVSIDLRIVLGALLVKHIEGISDEDTILCIQENIYVQYFVGLPAFQSEPVFTPSLFVLIRKRLGRRGVEKLNDVLLVEAKRLKAIKHRLRPGRKKPKRKDDDKGSGGIKSDPVEKNTKSSRETKNSKPADKELENRGTLKLDATVAPQHIGYPTDTALLHQARLYSEGLIDKLYKGSDLWTIKPRTYRRKAHSEYVTFAKKRKKRRKEIKRMRGKQLRYVRRNLKHINGMLDELEQAGQPPGWRFKDWQRLWVLQELYRQQDIMHRDGRRRIDHRIVNIAQPYVRPIIRGKAGKDVEFGAKINVSETEGFTRMDQVSFNSFHEGKYLTEQVEAYKSLYGYYPELALVDRIYLTLKNRKYLKKNGIRHSGKALGRTQKMTRQEKLKRKKEQNKRSEIEGKFGQAKSKYGLDDIKTRSSSSSYATIGLILLALNVIKLSKTALGTIFNQIQLILKHVINLFEPKNVITLDLRM